MKCGFPALNLHYRSRRETYRIRANAVRNLTAVAAGTGIVVQSIPWARFRSVPLNGRRPGLGRSSRLRFVVSGAGCQMGAGPDCKSGVCDSRGSTPRRPTITRVSVLIRYTVGGGANVARSELIYTT